MAGLILRSAVVAGAGKGSFGDLREIENEIRGKVWMGGVDTTIEDGDADTFAGGDIPRAMCESSGNTVAVTADLTNGPALRRVVVAVGGQDRSCCRGRCGRSRRYRGSCRRLCRISVLR